MPTTNPPSVDLVVSSGTEAPEERHSFKPPIPSAEILALIGYAAEQGIVSDGRIIQPLLDDLAWYSNGDGDEATNGKHCALVIISYAKLARLTAPVTGRSLLETRDHFKRAVFPLHAWTLLILLVVVVNEMLELWTADIVEPEEGMLLLLIELRRHVLDVCSPFLWGALGSCVWLLKRLSDVAESHTFDRALARGWTNRILLGAILGGIVQYLYDPLVFVSEGFRLAASAIGFMTGVGVKIVYGAIERAIEVIAAKMNLGAAKDDQRGQSVIRDFLTTQLTKINKEDEPEQHALLVRLVGEVRDTKTP